MPAAQQSSMQQFVGKWQILSAGRELHLSALRNGEMLPRIDERRLSDLLRRCGLHELRIAAVVHFRFKVAKSFADGRVYIALLDKNNALHTWNTSSGTNTIRRGQNFDETTVRFVQQTQWAWPEDEKHKLRGRSGFVGAQVALILMFIILSGSPIDETSVRISWKIYTNTIKYMIQNKSQPDYFPSELQVILCAA